MPQLYNETIEKEIRDRFIKKVDKLIESKKAASYKEVCDNLDISTASFNQIKTGVTMPTMRLLYNFQIVYKESIESLFFRTPPHTNQLFIRAQLNDIQMKLDAVNESLHF